MNARTRTPVSQTHMSFFVPAARARDVFAPVTVVGRGPRAPDPGSAIEL
ncbi:hypothetical protein [Streptomyces cellulosae]|nr:hypothetical protein [Streptomyces cellulosae]